MVVVSPHLDDGVLSLGATMALWARRGSRVELLTVLAGDPRSDAPAGGWDSRGGFRTEGEAARGRREEDRRACAILGATPVWLHFGDVDYERHGDEQELIESVTAEIGDADAVLLPGAPLSHPDHRWLTTAIVASDMGRRRLGFYAEQPYTQRLATAPEAPPWLAELVGADLSFEAQPAGARDRLAKWRAVRRYRSQLPLLAMARSLSRGPHALALAPEAIAWVPDRGDRGRD